MQQALRQVKETLGPEAVILSTKTLKYPSHKPGIEVIAAIDRQLDSPVLPSPEKNEELRMEDRLIQRMLSSGLPPELVHSLDRDAKALHEEFHHWNRLETYRGLLRSKVMENVEVLGPNLDGSEVWSFVGPTGVGKTTTLVKLAAHFSLKVTSRITLITIDTYRIGAVEQLRTYAEILHLPLEVALHPQDLREIVERNRNQDLLLIDTAGRSPNDTGSIEELRDFLTAHPRIENHLLLSATMKDQDLEKTVRRFGILPIKSYIFTKLDETEAFVPLFNQLARFKRPLSYLTKGQKVPEDIEPATKVGMANLVLNQIEWN